MKKHGCGQSLVGCAVLVVIAGLAIRSCALSFENARKAEVQRRASLTPEQRQAEDQAAAAEEAKRNEEAKFEKQKLDAIGISQDYVCKFLKHPDDASFGFWDIPDMNWNETRSTVWVSSKVKAKNDFGAELTYRWETILTLNGKTWELVSCAIDGEKVYESETLMKKILSDKKLREAELNRQAAVERAEAEKGRQIAREESKWRTWTDASGKHTIYAKFGGMQSDKVTLIKHDGSKTKLPIDKLSNEDREWIMSFQE